MSDTKNTEIPIEIQPEQLSSEALAGIIQNFILREGTDYGLVEVAYVRKAEQIYRQIQKGDIKIVFDQTSETVSLLTKKDFQKLTAPLK